MYIYEIENGSYIEVTIKAGDKRMKFATTAVGPLEKPRKALIVEPVCNNDKVVNFKGDHFTYEILAIPQGNEPKPFLWKQAAVTLMKNAEGKLYHVIVTDQEGKQVNRRASYRLFMGCDAMMQLEENGKEVETFLRDISATGFSIVCSDTLTLNSGTNLTLMFHDEETDVKFKLHGKVVRVAPIENQPSVVYGCKLRTESPYVHKYVVEKQRRKSQHAERVAKQEEANKQQSTSSEENLEKDEDK
ncbi:MAG: PilZ domain-containing protein [Eubacteriales bacterium]